MSNAQQSLPQEITEQFEFFCTGRTMQEAWDACEQPNFLIFLYTKESKNPCDKTLAMALAQVALDVIWNMLPMSCCEALQSFVDGGDMDVCYRKAARTLQLARRRDVAAGHDHSYAPHVLAAEAATLILNNLRPYLRLQAEAVMSWSYATYYTPDNSDVVAYCNQRNALIAEADGRIAARLKELIQPIF